MKSKCLVITLVSLMLADLVSAASPDPRYVYIPIPSDALSTQWGPPVALFVNDRGQVAGDFVDRFPRGHGRAGFFFEHGSLTILPTDFAVSGLFNAGVVAGTDYGAAEYAYGLWTSAGYEVVSPRPYVEILGIAEPHGIVGIVAGDYGTLPLVIDAFTGDVTVLDAVGCEECGADGYIYGGNVHQVYVGTGDDGNTFAGQKPIVWRDGLYSYLPATAGGAPTASRGRAVAINDEGLVVGYLYELTSGGVVPDYYAAAWVDDSPRALSSNPNSGAWDVSNPGANAWDYFGTGIVVGEVDGLATMWCAPCFADSCEVADPYSQLTSYNLNDLVVNEGIVPTLMAAYSINECGVIVGRASEGSFMLVPQDSTDTDGDGLLDSWEICGIDGNGDGTIDFVLPDADPEVKDLYLEIDAMMGHEPPVEALEEVVRAFAVQGIRLHIPGDISVVSDQPACDPCVDQAGVDPTQFVGGMEEAEAIRCQWFGSQADQALPEDMKEARLRARSMAFRYMISADRFVSGKHVDSVGLAWVESNLAILALGRMSGGATVDEWAGVIMHELGHGLGLRHGGTQVEDGEDRGRFNFKPNYPSVMNYTWTMPVRINVDLPQTAKDALQLWQQSWTLDFSHGLLPTLDESSLPEESDLGWPGERWTIAGTFRPYDVASDSLGIQLVPMWTPIDWAPDLSGPVTDININYIPGRSDSLTATSLDVLTDVDDWSVLRYLPHESARWSYFPFDACGPAAKRGGTLAAAVDDEMTISEFLALGRIRFDCNGNRVADDVEIDAGTAADVNGNAVPDECEATVTAVPGRPEGSSRIVVTPNPFNPRTTVLLLDVAGMYVKVEAFDARGRKVAHLYENPSSGSSVSITWDAGDLPSGVYFVKALVGDQHLTEKVVLIR